MSAINHVPPLEVDYDQPGSAYLVRVLCAVSDDQHVFLRDHVLAPMIETGELTKAGYDVGANGALAFRIGTLDNQPPLSELDDVGHACSVLEVEFEQRWEATLAATAS